MSFGNFFDKLLFMETFYKLLYKNGVLIIATGLLCSFPVFSYEKKICNYLVPWEIRVCGDTDEERGRKIDLIDTELQASSSRMQNLPEKVTEAGQAVFKFSAEHLSQKWNGDFPGGSGFFMSESNRFFTNYHTLDALLGSISDWSDVVFRDQNGNTRDLHIKGVKFASKLQDTAILEVEGYEGPVLEPAETLPQELSYIVGYSNVNGFQVRSVRTFEATDIQYGAFIDLLDCYRGVDFSGSSGSPLVNKNGKVEGVFANMIHSDLPGSDFLMAKKLRSSTEEIKGVELIDTIEGVKELMIRDTERTIQLAESGNIDAQFELSMDGILYHGTSDPVEMIEQAFTQGNAYSRHIAVTQIMEWHINGKTTDIGDLLYWMLPIDIISVSQPQVLLPTTWYDRGVIAYYAYKDLEEACHFWEKAHQTGHPLIQSEFVIIPRQEIVNCGNLDEMIKIQ